MSLWGGWEQGFKEKDPAGGSLCLALLLGTWVCSAGRRDAALSPRAAPPSPGLLRKWHMIWKLIKICCVYETTPKSLKKGLALFTHKLGGL